MAITLTYKEKIDEDLWIVDGLFIRKGFILVIGTSYTGKTLFIEYIISQIIRCKKVFNKDVIMADILVIDKDTPPNKMLSQMHKFNPSGKTVNNIQYAPIGESCLLKDGSLLLFIQKSIIANPKIKIVVIDSLYSVSDGLNMNDNSNMNILTDFKAQLLKDNADLTVIIVHHISEHKFKVFNDYMICDSHDLSLGASVINQKMDEIIVLAPKLMVDNKLVKLGVRPISKREVIPTKPFIVDFIQNKNSFTFKYDKDYNYEPEIHTDILSVFKNEGNIRNKKNPSKKSLSVIEVYTLLKGKHGITATRKALTELDFNGKLTLMTRKPNSFEYELKTIAKKIEVKMVIVENEHKTE